MSVDAHDIPGELVFRPGRELLAVDGLPGAGTQAFHELVGQITVHHLDTGHRGLAVCGASVGVGVTFVASNLAAALARIGVPTLLLDANLHAPGIQRMIEPSRPPAGLQQLLRGEVTDRSEIECVEVLPNLSIIYSGGPAPDASELISSFRLTRFIENCMRDYAFTVIDTPAANRSADALRISRAVGHSLIVARRNLTYVDDIEMLSKELAADGVNVIGALLNDA